jgi:hypothetical protein
MCLSAPLAFGYALPVWRRRATTTFATMLASTIFAVACAELLWALGQLTLDWYEFLT